MYDREKPHTKFDCRLKEEIRTIPVFFLLTQQVGRWFQYTNIVNASEMNESRSGAVVFSWRVIAAGLGFDTWMLQFFY